MAGAAYVSRGRFVRLSLGLVSDEGLKQAEEVLDDYVRGVMEWPNDDDMAKCQMEDGTLVEVRIGDIKADLRSLGA